MKIFTARQVRQWDQLTLQRRSISSARLMEQAAGAAFQRICELFDFNHVTVLAGTGNNGGDGLCIARMASRLGKSVRVYIAGDTSKASADFLINLGRLETEPVQISRVGEDDVHMEPASDLFVDALWGTGIRDKAEGFFVQLIESVNTWSCHKVAIDLPSGLLPDLMEQQTGAIVRAHCTLTFGALKPALAFPENKLFCGQIEVLDIGLDQVYEADEPSDLIWFDGHEAKACLLPFDYYHDKRDRGQVQLIAGSEGKMGAAVLAARAALRAGCGLVAASVPGCGLEILQTAVPEAMCERAEGMDHITSIRLQPAARVVAVGPGIGTADDTARMIASVLAHAQAPLVIDADALNLISAHNWMDRVPRGSVLTPHRREFDRLFGPHADTFARLHTMRRAAKKYGVTILLKGPATMVADAEGSLSFNVSGHAGLGTAGSGDVLTGIIAGLCARGHSPATAARLGAYVHGAAADRLLLSRKSPLLLSGELADQLPAVFGDLQ
ncbi:MAG: NAD(P)H-hydrate dehydratase [Flavobacteriales bacterium]|nr:NAD(P)H-hydrate dehydratase [Flavobacteriales bacterium]